MKKYRILSYLLLALVYILHSSVVFAADRGKWDFVDEIYPKALLSIGYNKYFLMENDQYTERKLDVAPLSINGRTMLPARTISELLGVSITYDAATKTAICSYDGKQIEFVTGSRTMKVNGADRPLSVPVTQVRGRVLLPLSDIQKALSEIGLSAYVEWDAKSRTIDVYDESREKVLRSREPKPKITVELVNEFIRENEEAILTRFEELLNEHRKNNGRSPLVYDDGTIKAGAVLRATEMAKHQKYSHDRPDGREFYTAFEKSTARALGENIHCLVICRHSMINVEYVAQKLFEDWKNSSGHNENMLNAQYTTHYLGLYAGENKEVADCPLMYASNNFAR